jgi:hypothetical protein
MAGSPTSARAAGSSAIPLLYRLFFLYVEPVATAVGAYALNEALVLRATNDVRVWKVFLFGLLLADFGHLASVASVGLDVYYRFWDWNSMYWGNLGFVYVGAATRLCFLMGVGFAGQAKAPTLKR